MRGLAGHLLLVDPAIIAPCKVAHCCFLARGVQVFRDDALELVLSTRVGIEIGGLAAGLGLVRCHGQLFLSNILDRPHRLQSLQL